MGMASLHCCIALVLILACGYANAQDSTTLVSAIITFGDSVADVGNNDYLYTIFKANYPPYGRDFAGKKATGRFCNGKLATDITAETLGFKSYAPPYLSGPSGKDLLLGANFASAGSGYDDKTAYLSHAISLTQQVEYFKEYKGKLAKAAGSSSKADDIIKGALFLVSFGPSDFIQNYYVNPYVNKVYTVDQYSTMLVKIMSDFIKNLYSLGATRIGVTSLPPLGCLPAARTLFGNHQSGCVQRINQDAQNFNKKANAAAGSLLKQLSGLKLVVFDIYKPLNDLIQSPSQFGFTEASKGCCGTGTVETTVFLCNPHSIGTCSNASAYVFWDAVHPSEAANQVLADALILQGFALL
uniref:GDSL esterase/lipase APG n=1 Tax=Kalanchoe fedtschenkoi TaxID=63787 RepID=A0A7N0VGD0_KALFE